MRINLWILTSLLFFSSSVLLAQTPAGYEQFYDEPTRVNLGGRWVEAEIALYEEGDRHAGKTTRIALVTDVTKFVDETERDLQNWVTARYDRCGERWIAGSPEIKFPPAQIQFSLALTLEVWNCGLLGRGDPARIAREGGRIKVVLSPFISDGQLQSTLSSFVVEERQGVSKYLPLEFVARRIIEAELKKLNQNPKFNQAPEPLHGEGFIYDSIGGMVDERENVWISAFFETDEPANLPRLTEKLRTAGLTQP